MTTPRLTARGQWLAATLGVAAIIGVLWAASAIAYALTGVAG